MFFRSNGSCAPVGQVNSVSDSEARSECRPEGYTLRVTTVCYPMMGRAHLSPSHRCSPWAQPELWSHHKHSCGGSLGWAAFQMAGPSALFLNKSSMMCFLNVKAHRHSKSNASEVIMQLTIDTGLLYSFPQGWPFNG